MGQISHVPITKGCTGGPWGGWGEVARDEGSRGSSAQPLAGMDNPRQVSGSPSGHPILCLFLTTLLTASPASFFHLLPHTVPLASWGAIFPTANLGCSSGSSVPGPGLETSVLTGVWKEAAEILFLQQALRARGSLPR